MALPISLAEFRALLKRRGLRPSKVRGQNFLFDRNLCAAVVAAAELRPGESVLEIGTGCGYLTAAIAPRAGPVLSVEIDPKLAAIAREFLQGFSNVELRVDDFLRGKEVSPTLAPRLRELSPFTVVANLPYSVGSTALVALALWRPPVPRMVVTVQKEVALRCAAPLRSADRGPLSLLLQLYYRAEILREVPPEVFWPRPKVTSAVVRLRRARDPLPTGIEEGFRRLVDGLFRHRRKQVQKSLQSWFGPSSSKVLDEAGIDPRSRPEELGIDGFLLLTHKAVGTL